MSFISLLTPVRRELLSVTLFVVLSLLQTPLPNARAGSDCDEELAYQQPDSRTLGDYNEIIGESLRHLVSDGDPILDLGGGQGVAFRRLAKKKGADAIVVDLRKAVLGSLGRAAKQGSMGRGHLTYVVEDARSFLRKNLGRFRLITDIWGAFSYTIEKIEMLDEIYAALQPGGVAFILYHPFKTPTTIDDEGLGRWLENLRPGGVRVKACHAEQNAFAEIIELRKPPFDAEAGREAPRPADRLDLPGTRIIDFGWNVTKKNRLPWTKYSSN